MNFSLRSKYLFIFLHPCRCTHGRLLCFCAKKSRCKVVAELWTKITERKKCVLVWCLYRWHINSGASILEGGKNTTVVSGSCRLSQAPLWKTYCMLTRSGSTSPCMHRNTPPITLGFTEMEERENQWKVQIKFGSNSL